MSNIIEFTCREAPLHVRIVASRTADGFSYRVILDDRRVTVDPLDADSLADARGLAAFFSDRATETGPPEAFREGPG